MNQQDVRNEPPNRAWKKTAMAAAITLAIAESSQAQDAQQQPTGTLAEVVVTATRRVESIQDVPFNIAAVDGAQVAEQGLTGISDLTRWTPGLYSANEGRGTASEIVARGLSIGGVDDPGFANNDAGGTVSTYVGEVPLYVDLRLTDIDRVEVLLGPQGTLYGAGTLGGAIRYIPRKPKFDAAEIDLRGDSYTYSESDGVGADAGFTVNVPFSEHIAFRASVDYLDDPGFVDFNFLVREPGVSDPEPDFSDAAAVARNLRRVKDANTERTLSGRAALRWQPNDTLDATLTYYLQDQDVKAGTQNHVASFGTGRYESADRFAEFNERRNQLASLEVVADLGFAELTSASGYNKYEGELQFDVTDLLNTLGYSYELFPSFVDWSPWSPRQNRFNQEVRLVSPDDGRFSWIAGGFYNKLKTRTNTPEFAPGFDQFAVDNLGGVQLRPDGLELANFNKVDLTELAFFGELSYKLTDAWKITVGARWYDYDQKTAQAIDFPLFETVFNGRDPNSVILNFDEFRQKAHGTLFKFSTSYNFTEDLMAYFTRSEGYRLGSTNPYALCSPTGGQNICVSPSEAEYRPDTTINWELGLRSQWFEHRLIANASVFYIDWKDPQLHSLTQIGQSGITVNGKGARTRGFDLSLNAALSNQLTIRASYSYLDAELTTLAPDLLGTIPAPGTNPGNPFLRVPADGLPGDRLPHSPQHQGTVYLSYTPPLAAEWQLSFHYGVTAVSSILTTVGGRADGETLGGYALHSASAVVQGSRWALTLYADNLFNKYARTGTSRNRNYIQSLSDINGDPVTLRSYSTTFVPPRQVGLRFTYDMDL